MMSRGGSVYNDLDFDLCWQFTDVAIEAAPDQPGVFALFNEKRQHIVLGSATKSLRSVLRDHWKGYEGRQSCGATYVGFEAHDDPLAYEAEIDERYQRRFGKKARRQAG